MVQDNMLNYDAGLHEAAPVVDKHWKALQGPDACELAEVRRRIWSEHLQLKWDVVLVERNQNLLTVGREGMRIKNKFHRQRAHFLSDHQELRYLPLHALPPRASRREETRTLLAPHSSATQRRTRASFCQSRAKQATWWHHQAALQCASQFARRL